MKIIVSLMISLLALFGASYSTQSDWLMQTPENQKFEAIQKQFRGFDTAMMEVGYRYEAVKHAVQNNQYDLALYHWDKIKTAIDNGIIRRPARKPSADAYFLSGVWVEFGTLLKAKNKSAIDASFVTVKDVCNACHSNQKVGFIEIK